MKTIKLLFVVIQLSIGFSMTAQKNEIVPDLSKIKDGEDLFFLS